jgi:hypothetical protein
MWLISRALFISHFLTNIFYAFHLPHTCTCPTHLIAGCITQILCGKHYKLWAPSLCSFLHLHSNVPLSTLFLNTLCYFCKFYTQKSTSVSSVLYTVSHLIYELKSYLKDDMWSEHIKQILISHSFPHCKM